MPGLVPKYLNIDRKPRLKLGQLSIKLQKVEYISILSNHTNPPYLLIKEFNICQKEKLPVLFSKFIVLT